MAPVDHLALAARAHPQLGLLRRDDLAQLGVSMRQVQGMTRSGLLRRLGTGVWVLAAARPSPEQRLLAATLQAGEGAVASHLTAAWVWRFDGIRPRGIELSVERPRNPRIRGVRIHRVAELSAVDVTHVGSQPVTTPTRTLFDIAALVPERVLEEAFDGARRRQIVSTAHLEWRLADLRRRGRPGVTAIDALLAKEHTAANAESWLESAFLRLVRDAALPAPRVQVELMPVAGGRRMRLDAIYEDHLLVAEVGGHATHASRRERQTDAERRANLVTMGLRVVDFTYEDVTERPDHVVATLRRLLGLQAPG